MPKKLQIIDPNTGVEIVEHFVEKRATNHTELEGETFGLGSDTFLNIPDRITTRKTPRLTRGQDKTVCLFPGVAGESEVFLDHIQFNKLKKGGGGEDNTTFIHEDNKDVTYRNGQKGIRHSLSIFPCMSHNNTSKQRLTWKDKPDVLYDKKGIRNRELTVYFKVGDPIDSAGLRRVVVRLGGAWNVSPVNRSFIEIGYPTQDYPDIYFDVAYAAGKNVLVSTVNQYFAGDRAVPHKWIGLKIVSLVDKSKSHIWYGIYIDLNPFDDNDIHNSIPSNNWKLKADIIFTGVKEYANIIPTWKCEYDSIVIDGYESVEFRGVSDREVDFMGLKPLHQNLSVMITETDDDDTPLFRKAMVPTWFNLNDYELQEDVVTTNNNTTSTSTSKKVSHTTLSLPRADRDSNPKDPGFYGVYTH